MCFVIPSLLTKFVLHDPRPITDKQRRARGRRSRPCVCVLSGSGPAVGGSGKGGWTDGITLCARSIILHKMYKTCCKGMLATWCWLPLGERTGTRPLGPTHPRGAHGGVLVFLHGASRGHESAPSCPNTSMRKRAMICGERFGRGLRSSYSPRRSAASATPGAGRLRSPRRICW